MSDPKKDFGQLLRDIVSRPEVVTFIVAGAKIAAVPPEAVNQLSNFLVVAIFGKAGLDGLKAVRS